MYSFDPLTLGWVSQTARSICRAKVSAMLSTVWPSGNCTWSSLTNSPNTVPTDFFTAFAGPLRVPGSSLIVAGRFSGGVYCGGRGAAGATGAVGAVGVTAVAGSADTFLT